ncbi:flagellin [Poriferisphaera sp. WC338]|uniref:flagellin N-terminal helical domain-containing protein n=1 Tax=Poriferisphaera sp. WC338 TaxID=3425129 RepID=UPI003D818CF1
MSGFGPINSRTTTVLQMQTLQQNLQRTQLELFRAQQQVSTGKKYGAPSEGSSSVSAILQLQQTVNARVQWDLNLEQTGGILDTTDNALGSVTTTLTNSISIASSQIGIGSDADTRKDQAIVIDEHLQSILNIANQQYNGISLFGGNNGAVKGGNVFEEFLGGIRYVGGDQNLEASVGTINGQTFTSNGIESFGALSSRVESKTDLQVRLTSATNLNDLDGALNQGIRKGTVVVNVNGSEVQVDLSNADTVNDVAQRINQAIADINPVAGSVSLSGPSFALTATAGNTISIQNLGAGKTASDLGLDLTAASTTVAGTSTKPRLTETTLVSALGASVDLTSGLQITQGGTTKTIDFSSANTIQDLINTVAEADLGVRLEINQAGNGVNLVSEVSGLRLTVGENGGTTARDLGISTLSEQTELASFREGLGVETKVGENDFQVQLHDGTTFEVDVTGAVTIQDVIDRMNAAATAAGATVPGDFNIGFATTGTGVVFTDNTAGGSNFAITNLGTSQAATHLGFVADGGAGSTITSEDNAKVVVDSLFTNLMDLSKSLRDNDESGIIFAGDKLEKRNDQVILARAAVGVEAQRVALEQERSKELGTAEKSMLSQLQDADFTESITKYQLLQTQLQAALQVGASNFQQSLLNFLR